MTRIQAVTKNTADTEQAALLNAIQDKLGMVPNFLGILAQSSDALSAFLGLHTIAGKGKLDAQTRERIALVIAQSNSCQYCLSAHTAIGRNAGLDNDEMNANRTGTSLHSKASAAVSFAKALNDNLGDITQSEFNDIKNAGYSDAEIVEIITHVGMNILTNLIAKATKVEIDFPKISL